MFKQVFFSSALYVCKQRIVYFKQKQKQKVDPGLLSIYLVVAPEVVVYLLPRPLQVRHSVLKVGQGERQTGLEQRRRLVDLKCLNLMFEFHAANRLLSITCASLSQARNVISGSVSRTLTTLEAVIRGQWRISRRLEEKGKKYVQNTKKRNFSIYWSFFGRHFLCTTFIGNCSSYKLQPSAYRYKN